MPSSTMQRSIQSISESSRLQAESTTPITSRTRNYYKLKPTLYAPSVGVNPEQVTSPTTAAIPSTISSDVDVVSVETPSGNANPTTTTPDVKTGNGPDERKPPKFGYKSGVPMFRPVEEYPTDVDLTPTPTATTVHVDPEVSPPNDVITVANIKKVSATQNKPSLPRTTVDILSADLRGGGGQSIPAVTLVQVNTKFTKTYEGPLLTVDTTDKNGLPTKLVLIESPKHNAPLAPVTTDAEFIRTYRGPIHTVLMMNRDGAPITMLMVESTIRPINAKITPSVTMVAIGGKIAETYRGVIQTLDTTDQNGKPTTLLMVESTIVPTPSVTMITVDSKFAKTYQGSIRTVHTTNKDGNPTTLLMIESTIDPNNAPSVTLAADNNFEETYVADGRLQTIGTTNADGSSTTMLMFEVPITTTGTQTASNASATAPSTQPTKSSTNLNDVLGYRVIYFGAHYLPTLLAVILSMFWKVIDTDIKRIEPFYLLSHPAGTSAETLTENLLFGNSMIIPFQAAWRRQWIVCLSAIIYCPLLTGVQFLASSAISLTTHRKCDGFAKKRTCGIPFVVVQSSAARALQGVLGAVVLAVIAIVLLQRRRKSLLHSEPWSLAGLATMLADWSATKTAFSRIRVSDSEEDLKRTVMGRKNKYRLVETTYHEKPHLGIELVGDPNEATSTDMEVMVPESETSEIYSRQERSRRPPMLKTATLIIFTLFLCGMLSVILIYSLTYSSLIEHFMSGQGRGVNILFIALGVTVRFGWEPIDRGAYHGFLLPLQLTVSQRPVTSKYSTPSLSGTGQCQPSYGTTPAHSPW